VEAPDDGPYIPALANYVIGISRRNDFVVTSARWDEAASHLSADKATR
jgi:hypothetical protein